jgi:hypothetical protein
MPKQKVTPTPVSVAEVAKTIAPVEEPRAVVPELGTPEFHALYNATLAQARTLPSGMRAEFVSKHNHIINR